MRRKQSDNAYVRIRKAMLANERKMLAHVRAHGRLPWFFWRHRIERNALARLEAKHLIRYSPRLAAYVPVRRRPQ